MDRSDLDALIDAAVALADADFAVRNARASLDAAQHTRDLAFIRVKELAEEMDAKRHQ